MDFVNVLTAATPVIVALIGFLTAYMAHRKAENQTAIAAYHSTAYDTVSNLVNKLLIAGKDQKITEDEWQEIADQVAKDLQNIKQ